VNNSVYNLVDKRVGKFEDNSVDKQVDDQSAQMTWLNMWSDYLSQAPFSQSTQTVNAAQVLQQLVEASLQGDSCIEVEPSQIAALADLAVSSEIATTQVAPCVYDQQGLALYRYWHLEQRLAQQICRLKRQTIQAVDAEHYQDLLSDEHQQAALKMVLQQGLSIITGGPGTGKPILWHVLLQPSTRPFPIFVLPWQHRQVKLHNVCRKHYRTHLMIQNYWNQV
jgi:exodeoxyribonuclease V alpha subunit